MKPKLVIIISLLVLSLGVVFWVVVNKKLTSQSTESNIQQSLDACDIPLDKTLRSVDKQAVLEENSSLGYLTITFQNDELNWRTGDAILSGTYTCQDGEITANFQNSSKQGRYNPTTKILQFDGLNYKVP